MKFILVAGLIMAALGVGIFAIAVAGVTGPSNSDENLTIEVKPALVMPLESNRLINITNWNNSIMEGTSMTVLCFGPVTVHPHDGSVTIRQGVSIDEASREFWKSVEKAYPAMFPRK